MSGFSILDSCEKLEKSPEAVTGKPVEVPSLVHDDSLLAVVMKGSTSINEQSISNKSKSDEEDYYPHKQNQTIKSNDPEVANTSLNATLTMFPPTLPCTSPISQDTTLLSELAQSTPNAQASKSTMNIDQSDRCRIKVKRNNSKNSIRHRSARGSPFTRKLSNEKQDKSSQDTCESPRELSLDITKTSSCAGVTDTVTITKEISDISFGSLSKSLEQAMVKQVEIVSTTRG